MSKEINTGDPENILETIENNAGQGNGTTSETPPRPEGPDDGDSL